MRASHAFWLFCWCALIGHALADWDIRRFEGRDYVSLEGIAKFYGFPEPPPLPATVKNATGPVATPGATAAFGMQGTKGTPTPVTQGTPAPNPVTMIVPPPSRLAAVTGKVAAAATPTPPSTGEPPANAAELDAPPAAESPATPTIKLASGKSQLIVTLNSRDAMINGARQWLSFPILVMENRAWVSRLDLAKVIEPRLRPEKIEGLQPVETVVLDPGHGGHDNGAICSLGYEKNFALDVALRARTLLEAQGYKVVMTRSADIFIPLQDRPKVANRIPNSIFVSIHFNSASWNSNAHGFEIFSISPRGGPSTDSAHLSLRDLREEPGNTSELGSTALAGSVYHSLLGQVPNLDRGIKQARFAVLRLCTVPAILIECGFVTNPAESSHIATSEWRNKLAEAILQGIENYKLLAEKGQVPKVVADYRRAAGETQN